MFSSAMLGRKNYEVARYAYLYIDLVAESFCACQACIILFSYFQLLAQLFDSHKPHLTVII